MNIQVTLFIKLQLQSHLLSSPFINTIPILPKTFTQFYLEFTVKAKWEHTEISMQPNRQQLTQDL